MRSSIDEKSYSVFDATLAIHIDKERTRLEAAADARPIMKAAIRSTVREMRERRWNESVIGVAKGGGYRGPGQIQEPRGVGNNENGGYDGCRGYGGSGQGKGSVRGLDGGRRGYQSGQASQWQEGCGYGAYNRDDQSGRRQVTFSSVMNVSDGRCIRCGMGVTAESEW
jgi:hypothetical protein